MCNCVYVLYLHSYAHWTNECIRIKIFKIIFKMVIGLLILVVLRVKRVLLVIWHLKLLKDVERIKPLMRRYTYM